MDTSYKAQSGDDQYLFLAEQLAAGVKVPVARLVHGPTGAPQPATTATPLPVRDVLGATAAGQDAALAVLQQIATAAGQAAALAVLQQILAKLISSPATAQGQADQLAALATLVGQTDGIEGSLTSILAKLSADPATATAQAAELAKLTSIESRLPASPHAQPLTDAQLRATPVIVAASRWAEMEASMTDTTTAGTTYVLLEPGTAGRGVAWAVRKIISTPSGDTITVAGPGNNAGVSTGSAAWAARTTLTYSVHQGA